MGVKLQKLFMKQKLMRKVIYSLIPIIVFSIYNFGLRVLALLVWVTLLGCVIEWFFERQYGKPVSEAVIVTCILYTLTLPPTTPFWVAGIGIAFGVIFGKEVFGGFGKNIFNPALVARCFIYISFPEPLTMRWLEPASGFPGGFGIWATAPIDALAHATPMLIFRESGQMESMWKLLMGNVSGSIGETSALLIIGAAIYLIYTKTASWQTMASTLLGYLAAGGTFYLLGASSVPHPLFGLLSGGLLFGVVFMATDPISSPMRMEARWIYGLLIGVVTVIIRGYALFAGGIMFAILIGNTFAPIFDEGVKAYKEKRKQVAA